MLCDRYVIIVSNRISDFLLHCYGEHLRGTISIHRPFSSFNTISETWNCQSHFLHIQPHNFLIVLFVQLALYTDNLRILDFADPINIAARQHQKSLPAQLSCTNDKIGNVDGAIDSFHES